MIGARRTLTLLLVLATFGGLLFFALHNIKGVPKLVADEVGNFGDIRELNTTSGGERLVKTLDNKIYFVGDIFLGRDVERRLVIEGADYPYRKISIWNKDDVVVANFESAVPNPHVPAKDNSFRFSTRSSFLPALRSFGVTHLSLANNHSFDFGAVGYNQTLSALSEADFSTFGHPAVVSTTSITYIPLSDLVIAVMGIHTLYGYPSVDQLMPLFETMSANSDYQLVFVHWGDEYTSTPNTKVKSFAKVLVDLGADAIVGHHPHVVQSIALVDDAPVFYSLGNFIFDQYFSEEVQTGLVIELSKNEQGLSFSLLPVSSINSRNQPYLMDDVSKTDFLSSLASTSDESIKEQIINGQIKI